MMRRALDTIWPALGGDLAATASVRETGEGGLPSYFSVTDLAAASIGAAGLSISELLAEADGTLRDVAVDRRLASLWFGRAIVPEGWEMSPGWEPLAGDYETRDGWIKLHTNAPHHRAAALAVLGCIPEREAVATAVRRWTRDALEEAVVGAGGCAAAMRSETDWAAHPQGAAVAAEPLVGWTEQAGGAEVDWRPDPSRPLLGLRVLDLTRVLAGPVATRFLAGFGAEVLRIDPLDWDEPGVVPDVVLGKSCARLDLRSAEGKRRLETLLQGADILVHGYRPGALAGLGFDEGRRRALRPGLVEVCLDAYGWTGPWSGRRGFDSLVQMSSGIAETGMRRSGADKPVPLPVQALDHATGYIMAAAAIRGVTQRLRTGAGSFARASLARTAALLTSLPRTEPGDFPKLGAVDLAAEIETTSWGAARRPRPACSVDGAPMRWDLPARELGSAEARWSS
jgi:crotonobetainyl-CoA:carnitine CoA-transferase CaiB-like acyl-CoA transferase